MLNKYTGKEVWNDNYRYTPYKALENQNTSLQVIGEVKSFLEVLPQTYLEQLILPNVLILIYLD